MVYFIEMSCRMLFVRRVDITVGRAWQGLARRAAAARLEPRPRRTGRPISFVRAGISCRVGFCHASVVSLTHGRRRQSGKVPRGVRLLSAAVLRSSPRHRPSPGRRGIRRSHPAAATTESLIAGVPGPGGTRHSVNTVDSS